MTKPTEQFDGLRTINKPEPECNCRERLHLPGAVLCPDCKPEQPASAPRAAKENLTPIIKPETGDENSEVAGQPPEQPNTNAMIFEQVEGCCEMIEKLLEQLIPKTTHVEGCIITHKAWQDNNLKYLKGGFE